MRKPRVAFSIADEKNLPYFQLLEKSLRKFHSEEELPLVLIGPQELASNKDPDKFYRATPFYGRELLKEYETVIKIDADTLITGRLDELWTGVFDAACVNNSNPREHQLYPIQLLDIHPFAYFNCGMVVMRSEEFVEHWWDLCTSPHFGNYQFREQDLLNIICYYGNYRVKHLDSGDSFYGLASKGYWQDVELRGDDLVLPGNDEWNREDKTIRAIHWAGGNLPDKMNYRIRFQPAVVERLDWLTK